MREEGSTRAMDITVSRLNERMALRVPSELPLGLVFIVGQIDKMKPFPTNRDEVALQLVEGEHSLPCRLPQQVVEEMQLVGHERVRAGGHLVFDPRQARYYLLARDIEVLPSEPDMTPPSPPVEPRRIITDDDVSPTPVAPGELPPWVRQLAPPEIQAELGLLHSEPELSAGGETSPGGDKFPPPLPPEMVDYLSAAIDSDEDVELTPAVVHELLPRRVEESSAPPPFTFPSRFDRSPDSALDNAQDSVEEPDRAAGIEAEMVPEREAATTPFALSSQQLTLVLLASVFGFLFLVLLVLLIIALSGGFTLPLPA